VGKITPGDYGATSGRKVYFSPSVNTEYTLTVTNSEGSIATKSSGIIRVFKGSDIINIMKQIKIHIKFLNDRYGDKILSSLKKKYSNDNGIIQKIDYLIDNIEIINNLGKNIIYSDILTNREIKVDRYRLNTNELKNGYIKKLNDYINKINEGTEKNLVVKKEIPLINLNE
jgi:hypothetical protein